MSKKIITLTDDEVVDILAALETVIQSYRKLHPECFGHQKWCNSVITRMQELYQRILTTPSSD